jgi:hypothetical protein
MEVWLAENGKKAILLGTAELLLTDLIHNEGYGTSNQPVIQKQLNILPAPGISANLSTPTLGSLAIKMRLRKPIQEFKRFTKDMNEIKTHAQQTAETANLANNQKIITISVLKCSNLKTVSS